MSLFVYNICMRAYYVAILLLSPFHIKAKKWISGRKNIFQKIEEKLVSGEKRIWVHCASLGEFEQGRPLIEKIKKERPNLKIVLTFFSPSGYEIRKNYTLADYVFYLPLDTAFNAQKFVSLVNPIQVVFVKYEFWYHYTSVLHKKETPFFYISAVFRPSQYFFSRFGAWYREILKKSTCIFVQDLQSKLLLNKYGIQQVDVSGDTRFDRVLEIAEARPEMPFMEEFIGNASILVAGSTWPEDENYLFSLFQNPMAEPYKWIIAPHEISEMRMTHLLKKWGPKAVRLSSLSIENAHDAKVLLVDNIGQLAYLYAFGKMAYVGGGFGKGVHNVLEAAVYGIPVFFGPNHLKSREALALKEKACAFSFANTEAFLSAFDSINGHPDVQNQMKAALKVYFQDESGATLQIFQKMQEMGL